MDFVKRLLFLLLVTAVLVFFSEKAYWYPQGYAVAELLTFYAFPVWVCLWVIDQFRVHSLAGMVLVAALFGFLVEGVLTPILYEGGLLDPILPAYFVGWHGLLSFVFGWYLIRRWLVRGQWRMLLWGSGLFGLLWGIWSLTYWLPETYAEFEFPGQWPVWAFGLYAFTFGGMLLGVHWLLGRSIWLVAFRPSRLEKWSVAAGIVFLFATLAFPAAPFGILKLVVLVTAVCLPLYLRRNLNVESVLVHLQGSIQARFLPILLLIPSIATAVYGLATFVQPDESLLRLVTEFIPPMQGVVGAGALLWAIGSVLRSGFVRSTIPEQSQR